MDPAAPFVFPCIHAFLLLAGAPLCAQTAAPRSSEPAGEARSVGTPCFEGTGGPMGDFDWLVETGELFVFDTTLTQVLGGPGGEPTTVQTVVNGVLDVRNLTIEEGGEVRVMGPNPLRILATGDVVIRGVLDASGFNARDVATLNTGNITEVGAVGGPSGGSGGNANVITNNSSPRGGAGEGAHRTKGRGGDGGETGFNAAPGLEGRDNRRPGGGGGGRFAEGGLFTSPSSASEHATSGTNGHPASRGAESLTLRALGGEAGKGPFEDDTLENDFFGLRPTATGGVLHGELPALWAGAGGGGGGNADPASTFPTPNWNFGSDEKGGAGGGGGGAIHVQALGRIVFGVSGQIRARGGRGALGENTWFLDHVGGTGGAGSGGHVVLESASKVDFTDDGAAPADLVRDWVDVGGVPLRSGANQFVNACCRSYSNGGASSTGVVQLHVNDPRTPPGASAEQSDIVVPLGIALQRNDALDLVASPGAFELFLTCDPVPRSSAGWVGVGGGGARAAFLRVLQRLAPQDGEGEAIDLLRTVPQRF